MMSNDKKKTILTIKNTIKKMDLLRVHIYEYSIRFDKNVATAIDNYPELKAEVEELNHLWKEHKINERQILTVVLHLMGKYGSYLENYYFKKEELDENGCYIDEELIQNIETINPEEEKLFFFEYFKEQKLIKKISKKAFEKEISENLADEYVEKYVFKGAAFYRGVLEEDRFTSIWYFMVVDNEVAMAFEKITK